MWTKCIALVCLLLLAPCCLWPQSVSEAILSAERIIELTYELDRNREEQQSLIDELRTANKSDLERYEKVLEQLRHSEQLLLNEIALTKNLGSLIDNQATYTRKLEKKLLFWRIFSGVLTVSLATTLTIWGASK